MAEDICMDCGGDGEDEEGMPCTACGGTGRIERDDDED